MGRECTEYSSYGGSKNEEQFQTMHLESKVRFPRTLRPSGHCLEPVWAGAGISFGPGSQAANCRCEQSHGLRKAHLASVVIVLNNI